MACVTVRGASVMECYLDNSATTAVFSEVAELMMKLFTSDYGNPSSMHRKGFEAEQYVKKAREAFAKIWKASEGEIFFTSGGTESDNMAILGAAYAKQRRGKHIITTKIEHAAVLAPFKYLEEQGFSVTYLSTDSEGIISLEELEGAMREDTILVSIMHVNNEIGAVQPVEEAGRIIKSKNPSCLFHVDDIQGFGKLSLYPAKMKIDLISVSGHKIHGPKGVGVLYVNQKAGIKPLILGGGQQKAMRSGTENVPGIAGIALAATIINDKITENTKKMYELREYFVDKLEKLDNIKVNGSKQPDKIAPHIVSLSVSGVRAEVLLHALEDKGVYVSAGSACSSNKPAISETLKAISLEKELLDSTVRFSFGTQTTKEELDYAYETLSGLLEILRKYSRK